LVKRALAIAALACAVAPLPGHAAGTGRLTIYSSLPLHGGRRAESLDVVRAERLALEEEGGAAGGHPIRFVSLDDSTRAVGGWDIDTVYVNAYRAYADDSAIAYLGELNSGASAVSMPILNEADLLQVSPSNSYVGLTRSEPGVSDYGEPGKYYPTGRRTYGRIAPADNLQAAAAAKLLAEQGVKRVLLLDDAEIYGAGLARMIGKRALARGVEVRGPFHVLQGHWRAKVRRLVRSAHADAMVFGGITENHAAGVFSAAHAAAPRMTLIGGDGVADTVFTKRLAAGAASRTFITNPTLPAASYPAAAQAFFLAFRARYGHAPQPYGLFGYETMKVVLAAIEAAGGNRAATVDAFFATRDRDSVLGRYSIDAHGDTTLSTYGVNRIRGGRLVFDRVIDSSA
jgi:branched-chain amino acid transport system substrate-binding protein